MVDLFISRKPDSSDELMKRLESLPSYDNLKRNSRESALFDDEQETSPGLISLIRRSSYIESSTTDSSNAVRIIQIYNFF